MARDQLTDTIQDDEAIGPGCDHLDEDRYRRFDGYLIGWRVAAGPIQTRQANSHDFHGQDTLPEDQRVVRIHWTKPDHQGGLLHASRADGHAIWKEASQGDGWTVVNLEQIAAWDPDKVLIINYFGDVDEVVSRLEALLKTT